MSQIHRNTKAIVGTNNKTKRLKDDNLKQCKRDDGDYCSNVEG